MSTDSTEDVIDSRDIIERIGELEADPVRDEEEEEELKLLLKVQKQADRSPDWEYGEVLINEDYFEKYMDEMVEDCYDLPEDLPCFINLTLDYDILKRDYFSIGYDDEIFWIRA